MTRPRCSKCGKFEPKQMFIMGTDPATMGKGVTINTFAIHLCGHPRDKKGKFIRRKLIERLEPYQIAYNLLMYKHGQTQPKM